MGSLSTQLARKFGYVYFKRRFQPYGIDLLTDLERFIGDRRYQGTIIDVGANVGQSACAYARHFPCMAIHSFEPVRSTYEKLVQACTAFPQIQTHHAAVGRLPGRVSMAANENSVLSKVAKHGDFGTEDVEQVTLDGFTANREITSINLLKSDTEGYDMEVLAGAEGLLARRAIKFVLAEATFDPTNLYHTPFRGIADQLGRFGYKFVDLYESDLAFRPGSNPKSISTNVLFAAPAEG